MTINFKKIWHLIKESGSEWKSHKPFFVGAAVSFYILLSLGPILTLIIIVIGPIFGKNAAQGDIVRELGNMVGQELAQVIQKIIKKASESTSNFFTILTSIPLLFFGSTMVFFQLKNALGMIWELKPESKNISDKLRAYSFSFLMLLIVGIFFLLIILKGPVMTLAVGEIKDFISIPQAFITIADLFFTYVLLSILFAMVYKILPEIKIKWFDIWVGGLVTAFLFLLVQKIIALNLANSNIENAFGAIGSFTILFLWIFYSVLIFLFGAEFTKVFSRDRGTFPKSK